MSGSVLPLTNIPLLPPLVGLHPHSRAATFEEVLCCVVKDIALDGNIEQVVFSCFPFSQKKYPPYSYYGGQHEVSMLCICTVLILYMIGFGQRDINIISRIW